MELAIQIGTRQQRYHVVKTNAPVNYDGFGTFTLYEKVVTGVRWVALKVEHVQWQTMRYGSVNYRVEEVTDPDLESAFETMLWERVTDPSHCLAKHA